MTTFIWDLDGTLIDSYEVFLEALSESFANFNLPFDRGVEFYSKGIRDLSYEQMRPRVYFDKTSVKKLATSIYGRYMPAFIKRLIRDKILK